MTHNIHGVNNNNNNILVFGHILCTRIILVITRCRRTKVFTEIFELISLLHFHCQIQVGPQTTVYSKHIINKTKRR